MRSVLFLGLAVVISSQVQAKVRPKVIYGADSRVEIMNSTRSTFEELGRSTAALVRTESLTLDSVSETYKMVSGIKTLKESLQLCSKEKFGDQPFLATCSGFLISENIMITAGHCYSGMMKDACESHVWVFDYKLEDESRPFNFSFPKENVYRCKKVLKSVLSALNKSDYSIIELERNVTDRTPLNFRTSGEVQVGEQLTVIGHPWGLPSKIADGAKVLFSDNAQYFTTNLDTFQGNSGSPVFNTVTGAVEGILVRGRTDSVLTSTPEEGMCRTLNVCNEDGSVCTAKDARSKGEDVTRMTVVAKELEKLGL